MIKNISFLLIAITVVFSCQPPNEKVEEPFDKLIKLVDQYAENTLENGNINALALAIYKDGKIYKNYYGTLDKNKKNKPNDSSLYELASISKVFIGSLVSKAVIEGKIKLDDSIQKYLGKGFSNLEYEGFPITIKHLLTHTLGLKHKTPKGFEAVNKQISEGYYENIPFNYDFSDFLEELKTAEVDKKPGTHYAYNTVGPELLSYILQQVYNRPYKDLLNIFLNELELKSTYLHDVENNKKHIVRGYNGKNKLAPGEKTPLIGSGMYANLPDLIKFMKYQLESDSPTVKEATRQLYVDEDGDGTAYLWEGLGVGEEEGFYYSKTGTSYGTQSGILICPDSNYGIILIANSTTDWAFNDWANLFYSKMEVDLIKYPKINLVSTLKPLFLKDKENGIKEFYKLIKNKEDYFNNDDLPTVINKIGYELLAIEGTKKKAIDIFEFAVNKFPDNYNLFDSLGEAYFINNDNKNALKNFKKSLELNPENKNAEQYIFKIEQLIKD